MQKEIVTAVIASLTTALILWAVGLVGQLPANINVPKGAVVAFDLERCPDTGWDEYKLAHGRFIRGIDRSGNAIDPDGERKAGSLQEDAFESHSHTTVQLIGDNNIDGVDSTARNSGEHHNQSRHTGKTGTTETRPKNVALLYCIKR